MCIRDSPPPLPFNSEALSEDTAFQSRQLASLVASKVYFHLGNLDEALAFALGAGSLFDVELAGDVAPQEAQYVETIICTCSLTSFHTHLWQPADLSDSAHAAKAIDSFTSSRSASAPSADAVDPSRVSGNVDKRLEAIVERMFERCERDGEYKQVRPFPRLAPSKGALSRRAVDLELITHCTPDQALGIALSSRRLDVVQRIFDQTKDASLLEWILHIVVREGIAVGGQSKSYKSEASPLLFDEPTCAISGR